MADGTTGHGMKYIIAIVLLALIIGTLTTLGVYFILGSNPGYFYAKFIATPLSLVAAVVIFLIYDELYPKKK